MDEYKEDCYFYKEVRDMGGRIPTCSYYHQLGKCPCRGCKKHIDKHDAYQIIVDYVDRAE